jgi:signal transduction histidine kinase
MFRALINGLASFRAQMVAFMALILLAGTLAIYFINRELENRILHEADEFNQDITLATDLVFRSLSEGEFLYDLVEQKTTAGLAVGPSSTIRHIVVADADGKILDSTDHRDIGRPLLQAIGDLPPVRRGDIMLDEEDTMSDQDRTLNLSITTSAGRRNIIFVVSLNRLQGVIGAAARDRQIAMALVGVFLLVIMAFFIRRFTRPITKLAHAANLVKAGDLDFSVEVTRHDEIGALSTTFNEMIAGLRAKHDLEEKLQRAERSAVVGRLASGIAHEIRNPLNFINLSIDHLRERYAPSSLADRTEYTRILGMIKEEIARLNLLVSNFLSYGRPARLKTRLLDVASLVNETAGLVQAQADHQGVRIVINTLPTVSDEPGEGYAPDTRINADAEQLKTCISNIMINAVQAMPEGGLLTVTLRPSPGEVEIDLADTGVGIAPEALNQIFEPYYSTKETGVGLGLPLTRKIIEEHGGEITVRSEAGEGTVFTISLPRYRMNATPSSSQQAPALSRQ